MELQFYLEKVEINKKHQKNEFTLGFKIKQFSELEKLNPGAIGIIGIVDDRVGTNSGCAKSANLMRSHLYKLYSKPGFPEIIDFGNIKSGKGIEDTESAVQFVLEELLKLGIIPFIIGSKFFASAAYNVLKKIEQEINIAAVEPTLNLEINKDENYSYLEKIILNKDNSLYNFSNIGFQSYLISHKELELYRKMNLDAFRLGFVRKEMLEIEPVLRDTHFFIIDISAVKQSDAPGSEKAQPNGFYSEEICQLAKFAAMGNRIQLAGLFEINPDFDSNEQTVKLSAQILWHFIEGLAVRKKDHPAENSSLIGVFTEFVMNVSGIDEEIIFIKNNTTLRWWIKLPQKFSGNTENKYIACSSNDYLKARNNEVPDRLLSYINRTY